MLSLSQEKKAQHEKSSDGKTQTSATGPRTQVARVKAEYPSQLDYSGSDAISKPSANTHNAWRQLQAQWLGATSTLEREAVNLKVGSPSPPGSAISRSVIGLRAVMVVAPRISRWSHITPKLPINQQERSTAQWRKRKQTKAKSHDKQQEKGSRMSRRTLRTRKM